MSFATACTRTVKLLLPALAGSLRRLPATVRKLCAAESSLLLDCELTALFHWLIAWLLWVFAVLHAATGSGFAVGLVLLLDFEPLDAALLEDVVDLPDFEDEPAAELLLCAAELGVDGALLVEEAVEEALDEVAPADVAESEELPPEQALNPTRPHAATATTLRRRAWTWVVLIPPECPAIRPVSKSRDGRHAPADSTPRVPIAGCASTQLSTWSATHSG